MYVKWRTLFGLGTLLWVSLCLYDAYFIDPATKSFYYDSDEFGWLAQVSEDEIVEEDLTNIGDDIKLPTESYGFGISMVLWNLVAFFVTLLVCSVGKLTIAYLSEIHAKYSRSTQVSNQGSPENIPRKSTSSRIPILNFTKSSVNAREDIERERDKLLESCASLLSSSSTSVDLTVRTSKSEMSSRLEQQMEKQCAKLRDDMIILQANSLKEHAALSRKLESVSREKRDLYRQLVIIQKENRAAKQQLEELLGEKALLVKRLECASKEFKLNTKAKKTALANLEESQATIALLRQDLEKVTFDKEILENRYKILDAEHKSLKERLGKYEPMQDSFGSSRIIDKVELEPKKEVKGTSKDVKSTNLFEISKSQKDVQKVQMRLLNLEKSLDRLKLANWSQKGEEKRTRSADSHQDQANDSVQTDSENEFEKLMTSISTQAEPPLEGQKKRSVEKLLSQSDNLTDEQRRKILDPMESSGDEHTSGTKIYDSFIEFNNKDPFERVGNLLNSIKRPPSPQTDRFNVSLTDEVPNNTSTSQNEEEDTDELEGRKNRIVSNSPAFQKFLKNMDPLDRKQKKFIGITNIVF